MKSPAHIAPEPAHFATERTCLFLDVDGTLVDLRPRPDDVHIDEELLVLLQRIQIQLGGALALISGRPLRQLDGMFSPLQLPAAGIHGFERRCHQRRIHRPTLNSDAMQAARAILAASVAAGHGWLVEDKGCALALHFRGVPQLEGAARDLMQRCARTAGPQFELLEGDHVMEIKPAAQNKAVAIEAFLGEEPFAGRIPIYIGDDRTDLDGFGAVRRNGGVDIAVGEHVSARWWLENASAVRAWLHRFAAQASKRPALP